MLDKPRNEVLILALKHVHHQDPREARTVSGLFHFEHIWTVMLASWWHDHFACSSASTQPQIFHIYLHCSTSSLTRLHVPPFHDVIASLADIANLVIRCSLGAG